MIKGGERYKTDRKENSAPRKLTTMEPGLPFQTQERIKRTEEIYYLSNNSSQAQFTGAVCTATCSHHSSFKFIVRNQLLSKYIKKKNHTTKTPKTKQLKHHHHKKKPKNPVNKQRNKKAHDTTNQVHLQALESSAAGAQQG